MDTQIEFLNWSKEKGLLGQTKAKLINVKKRDQKQIYLDLCGDFTSKSHTSSRHSLSFSILTVNLFNLGNVPSLKELNSRGSVLSLEKVFSSGIPNLKVRSFS